MKLGRLLWIVGGLLMGWLSPAWAAAASFVGAIPVLAYHRLAEEVVDSMTVRNATFAGQIRFLREQGYTVIPLSLAVDALQGGGVVLPKKPLVITVDDGHRSVYSDLRAVIEREKIPVTLFIYPSAIANAPYAMTWAQLAELRDTGLFDIQSHTYWHPNFKIEKRRLSAAEYTAFVRNQLEKSRKTLKARLGVEASLLAWPFGIYDEELMRAAQAAGYAAAFSIDGRNARSWDERMSLPRHLMVDRQGVRGLAQILNEGKQ